MAEAVSKGFLEQEGSKLEKEDGADSIFSNHLLFAFPKSEASPSCQQDSEFPLRSSKEASLSFLVTWLGKDRPLPQPTLISYVRN